MTVDAPPTGPRSDPDARAVRLAAALAVVGGLVLGLTGCAPAYAVGDCVSVTGTGSSARASKVSCGSGNYRVLRYLDSDTPGTCVGVPGLDAVFTEGNGHFHYTLCLGRT